MLFILICFLYAGLVTAISSPFNKRLQRLAANVDDAILLRRRFKTIRNICIIVLVGLNLGLSYLGMIVECLIYDSPVSEITISSLIFPTIVYTVLAYTTGLLGQHSVFNAVSLLTFDEFLKYVKRHPDYFLYLRGFNTDNYTSVHTAESFSESLLSKHLSKIAPLFAVGMTKELFTPNGAKRIYLDDDVWKEEVAYLMYNATRVFILVNKNDNCLWEIEQSLNMIEKIYYIVDDMNQYAQMRQAMSNKMSFIDFDCKDVKIPFIFKVKRDKLSGELLATIYNFNNTDTGYASLIKTLYYNN